MNFSRLSYSGFRLDEVHGEPPSPHLAQRPGGHNLGGSRVNLSRQKSRGLKLRKTVSHWTENRYNRYLNCKVDSLAARASEPGLCNLDANRWKQDSHWVAVSRGKGEGRSQVQYYGVCIPTRLGRTLPGAALGEPYHQPWRWPGYENPCSTIASCSRSMLGPWLLGNPLVLLSRP
jgi:hypothetical protein